MIVADDHDHYRSGLVRRLGRDPRFEVVGDAAEGRAAVATVLRERPDVAVLDLRLVTLDALEVHDLVAAEAPELARRIIVLTATPDSPRANEVRAAIHGPVVGKNATRSELADAIAVHAASLRAQTGP